MLDVCPAVQCCMCFEPSKEPLLFRLFSHAMRIVSGGVPAIGMARASPTPAASQAQGAVRGKSRFSPLKNSPVSRVSSSGPWERPATRSRDAREMLFVERDAFRRLRPGRVSSDGAVML